MQWYYAVEGLATACNTLANAAILQQVCHDNESPMPQRALALQVTANAAWVAYACARSDHYLALTASMSLALQSASLCMRARTSSGRARGDPRVKGCHSDEELPSLTS